MEKDFDEIKRKLSSKKRSICVRLPVDLIDSIKKNDPKVKLTTLIFELLKAYESYHKKKG